MLRGVPVQLREKVNNGTDSIGEPIYTYNPVVTIGNILIAPATITEIQDALQLHGKKIVYNIAIPKVDNHNWEGAIVTYNGNDYICVNIQSGIDYLVPTQWHKKGQLIRYE